MAVERAAGGTSLIDVLDRVLDKGIVIDAWVRVSLVGIDLITVEARVVVASIDTYLKYSEAVGQVAPVSRPQAELPRTRTSWPRTRRCAPSWPRPRARRAEPSRRRPRRPRQGRRRSVAPSAPTASRRRAKPRVPRSAAATVRLQVSTAVDMEAKLALARVSADQHRPPGVRAPCRRLARRPRRRAAGGRRRVRTREPDRSSLVAEHGVSTRRDRRLLAQPRRRRSSADPGAAAAPSRSISTPSATFRSPLDGRRVPRRPAPRRTTSGPAHGLLVVERDRARTSIRDVLWLRGMLGEAGGAAARAGRRWPRRGSGRSGCCSTASSTRSPTRSC